MSKFKPEFKTGDRVRYYAEEARNSQYTQRSGEVVSESGRGLFHNKPPFLYVVILDGDMTVLRGVRESELKHDGSNGTKVRF